MWIIQDKAILEQYKFIYRNMVKSQKVPYLLEKLSPIAYYQGCAQLRLQSDKENQSALGYLPFILLPCLGSLGKEKKLLTPILKML